MSREAMQMALEALESDPISLAWLISKKQAITALRKALVDADDTSEKHVDEMVKTEHDKQIEIAQAYERGWNAALAQQEPVAWANSFDLQNFDMKVRTCPDLHHTVPLYTAPAKTPTDDGQPVAFINVEKQKLEWAKLTSWHTPTIVNLPKIPLYTAPPKQWVGLTKDEFDLLVPHCHNEFDLNDYKEFASAIEAKLKEKNYEHKNAS